MKTIEVDGIKYQEIVEPSNVFLVRTYSAGVHFGILKKHEDKEVVLTNARRLWSWRGAAELNQVAIDGVDIGGSKISVPVPAITLTEAIEIIPMSTVAAQQMMGAESWKK